jgi:hypothetical protein
VLPKESSLPASTEAYFRPVEALPKPVLCDPHRWARLESEPCSSQRLPTNAPPSTATATRSCFRTIDQISSIEMDPICASNAGERLVGSAVRKEPWEVVNFFFFFPCPTMGYAVPQKHQGGTVKQVLALPPCLGFSAKSRAGCWVRGRRRCFVTFPRYTGSAALRCVVLLVLHGYWICPSDTACTARGLLWENDPSGSVTAISRVAFDVDGMGGEAVMMVMSCPAFTTFRGCTERAFWERS